MTLSQEDSGVGPIRQLLVWLGEGIHWPTLPSWDTAMFWGFLYFVLVLIILSGLALFHRYKDRLSFRRMRNSYLRARNSFRAFRNRRQKRKLRAQAMGKRANALVVHRRLQDKLTDELFKLEEDKLITREEHLRLARTFGNILGWQDFLPKGEALLKQRLQMKHILKPELMKKHGDKLRAKQAGEQPAGLAGMNAMVAAVTAK